jgi:hypothetical protein
MLCQATGLGYTVLDEAGRVVEDRLDVPASKTDRGEQLDWLLSEVVQLFQAEEPKAVCLQRAGTQGMANPQRHEVEGIVRVAAYQTGAACSLLLTDQVRAKMGVKKVKGAYETLLEIPEVKARSNKAKREQYLYALVAR